MKKISFNLEKQSKNFFRAIYFDLKDLPFTVKGLIIIASIIILWNTFFDLNHFIDYKAYKSIWKFINNEQYSSVQQTFLILTPLASIFNIIAILLLAYSKITTYFWAIIGNISYGLYAIAWNYWGDVQLYLLFFLPLQFISYYYWKKHLKTADSLVINKLNFAKWLITIYALVLLATFFYFEIPEFSQTIIGFYAFEGNSFNKITPHIFDATTNALNIVAQILLLLRFREQWLMWILVDICQFAMYSGITKQAIDINMLILWSCALINGFIGCYQWYIKPRKNYQERQKLNKMTKPEKIGYWL